MNPISSYDCQCYDGFSGDRFSCSDIDDYISNPCDKNAIFDNTIVPVSMVMMVMV